MKVPRIAGAVSLLALAVLLISSASLVVVSALAALGLIARLATAPSRVAGLIATWPVLLFAGLLVLLGWFGGHPGAILPLKAVGAILLVVSAASLIPWAGIAARLVSNPRTRDSVLTALFTRHFVLVLGREARRLIMAQRVAAPHRWRRGWFQSLGWALAGLFRRSLVRAERFYIAQLVRGLGE